jgi:fructose-1,6-bisphosphatase/inositol monophosphatase family enzyme
MVPFRLADAARLAEILREAARAEIMPRFRHLAAGEIREKSGPLDLVTAADEAAERRITAAVGQAFPRATVIGEEATGGDLSRLAGLATHDLCVIVDPVDGTANFAAGLPLFGTMAAVVVRGEVVAGVIHDPVTGETAFALRGEGAWSEAADGRCVDLHVAAPVEPARMAGQLNWRFLPPAMQRVVCANMVRVAASWDYRCAAHEYRMAAAGHCHYLVFNRLLPWDHAAGWLLHQEAGGYAAQFDGSPYRPTVTTGGLICTPDAESWQALRAALLEA